MDKSPQEASALKTGDRVADLSPLLPLELTFKVMKGFESSSKAERSNSCNLLEMLIPTISEDIKADYFEVILPVLSLSRYQWKDPRFMLRCRAVWKNLVVEKEEVDWMTRFINQVVEYYLTSLHHEQLAIRIAACGSIGELGMGSKFAARTISPYLVQLLDALETAILDTNWEISNSATLAFGIFVKTYPAESASYVQKLVNAFYKKLGDTNVVVRKGASKTMSKIAKAYESEYPNSMVLFILHSLTNVFPFSVIRPLPWEKADGCLYLLGDCSRLQIMEKDFALCLQGVCLAARNKSYPQHTTIFETMCKIMPSLLSGMGKDHFKENLEDYLEIIFYVVELNTEASAYGMICLDVLSKELGKNIFRGRVEAFNSRMLIHLDNKPSF